MNERTDRSSWIQEVVEGIQSSGCKLALVATGGGSQALAWLLNHAGASRAILEAQVPYCDRALENYLTSAGPHPVSAETARIMALRAYERARDLRGVDDETAGHDIVGVACTAALATNRERRGRDRAWLALRSAATYRLSSLDFSNRTGNRSQDRHRQEDVLSCCLVSQLASESGAQGPSFDAPDWASVTHRQVPVAEAIEALYSGSSEVAEMDRQGEYHTAVERGDRLLLSGSFNPLHDGHSELAAAAEARSGRSASLEVSIHNVDKPSLEYADLMGRLSLLKGRFPVLITGAATFHQKATLFPGSYFVIGYDTARRLLDPTYYNQSEPALGAALELLDRHGSRFIVAGRVDEGAFRTLSDIDLPDRWTHLFEGIPEADFRSDLSSSQLRRNPDRG